MTIINNSAPRAGSRYADSYGYMEYTRAGLLAMIWLARNGGIQGKETHDGLPVTPDEIADSVQAAYQAGASMVYARACDARDFTRGAWCADEYHEANCRIWARCPEIITGKTSGGDLQINMAERGAGLDAGPELASLNLTRDISRFKMMAPLPSLPHPCPDSVPVAQYGNSTECRTMKALMRADLSIHEALAQPESGFAAANPHSRACRERACNTFPAEYSRQTLYYPPVPLTIASDGVMNTHWTEHAITEPSAIDPVSVPILPRSNAE